MISDTHGLGVSSVKIPIEVLINEITVEGLIKDIKRLMDDKNLGLYILGTSFPVSEEVHGRELLIYVDKTLNIDKNQVKY